MLLLAFPALQIAFHPASGPENMPRAFWITPDTTGTIVTLLLFSAVPAVLISLLPYKGRRSKSKLEAVFPAVAFVVLLIAFGYLEYLSQVKGLEIGPVR